MERSKNFIPSGLDEVFDQMMKHKQEAIAKGWIIEGKKPKAKPKSESEITTEKESEVKR